MINITWQEIQSLALIKKGLITSNYKWRNLTPHSFTPRDNVFVTPAANGLDFSFNTGQKNNVEYFDINRKWSNSTAQLLNKHERYVDLQEAPVGIYMEFVLNTVYYDCSLFLVYVLSLFLKM